jgi:hypothetical protein
MKKECKNLLDLCELYLDAVANASNMVRQFGLMSCYAFETQRQDIHNEMCQLLNLDYGKVGDILCNLEEEIGLPPAPIDGDEFRSYKLGLKQYAIKLVIVLNGLR